ncbi:hypothetical protein BH766_gp02 [Gordonia phage Demosthenes]|uniref:Uncharacterized protein n=3 Tax=Demosthenesvirus TaxID=1982106 RepID=A0A345MCD9_9CAUD|nr:hypothetical protein BH766_gp02 [Gordonia phage Demosthenes]ANA85972.1 hypothetical protein PBI_DEMOSTHENES_2 [Gordonia phage Demosthenes]AXH68160.1 hypothetical protein SEA_TEATEALATTE_2 [Gordonia phage Teatealatte]QBP29560.1 hypothetical protein SEA_TREDGE_2 [Gordonia phage Tredge]
MDFNELPIVKEVNDELADERFCTLRHGSPGTYHKGCRGPLCRKANRERVHKGRGSDSARAMDPYLESRTMEHWMEYEWTRVQAGESVVIKALQVVRPSDSEKRGA